MGRLKAKYGVSFKKGGSIGRFKTRSGARKTAKLYLKRRMSFFKKQLKKEAKQLELRKLPRGGFIGSKKIAWKKKLI